jgi:peptide/nickel transport system ATP-binding protein
MSEAGAEGRQEIVRVENLSKHFLVQRRIHSKKALILKAVNGVSFSIYEGETLGMVGETGCGKSTIGKTLLRAYPPSSGRLLYRFDGEEWDAAAMSMGELRRVGFRSKTQMIFQDPNSSLDPNMTILEIISEPLRYNTAMSKKEIRERVVYLMERVGLDGSYLNRYPHAFSGGQRQRISIARALSTNPRFIVSDEPTSALDVSIQAQILNLMIEIQKELRLSCLFISHNLGVIRRVSDRVAVMYLGRVVELADNESLFERPEHPYTEALMKAIPIADPSVASGMESAPGEIGNPLSPPPGCAFHPRCPYTQAGCVREMPELRDCGGGHFTACRRAETLALEGIKSRGTKKAVFAAL